MKAGWQRYRAWRRQRPFGAGVFLLPASVAIGLPPYASFRLGDLVLSIRTIGGMSALLIAALLLVCAVALWTRPQFRVAAGSSAIIVSLIALVTSNLGGFLVGTALGLVGGALALSWRPPADGARGGEQDPPPRSRATGVLSVVVLAMLPAVSPAAELRAAADRSPAAPAIAGAAQRAPAGRVWVLKAAKLQLSGLRYLGVATTRVSGKRTEVLRFTAHRIEITSLVQTSELVDGHVGTISAPPGSVSTATGNPVELLTLRLTGTLNLLGLIGIPVDFTPAAPPPLVLPNITLTDVTVVNTDLKHARMTIPAARLSVT